MTNPDRDLKPVVGVTMGLLGAVALIVGLVAFAVPRSASALPAYAQRTGLACGRCHVNPAGGGARTAFGKAFAANGHVVASAAKPGKASVRGEIGSSSPPPASDGYGPVPVYFGSFRGADPVNMHSEIRQ